MRCENTLVSLCLTVLLITTFSGLAFSGSQDKNTPRFRAGWVFRGSMDTSVERLPLSGVSSPSSRLKKRLKMPSAVDLEGRTQQYSTDHGVVVRGALTVSVE